MNGAYKQEAVDSLQKLYGGQQFSWGHVALFVDMGLIKPQEAVDALVNCISIIYPEYMRYTDGANSKYFERRLRDMYAALKQVNAGSPKISYMGYEVSLDKSGKPY